MIKKGLLVLFNFLLVGLLGLYGSKIDWNIDSGIFSLSKQPESYFLYYNLSLLFAGILIVFLVYILRSRTKIILKQQQVLEAEVLDRTAIIEKQKEELAHFIKLRDTVYAMIAHDLKDTIYSFRNLAQKAAFLLDRGDYNRLANVSTHIENSSFQLVAVVDNLLAWGMLEQGLLQGSARPISVMAITEKVVDDLDDLIHKKKLKIDLGVKDNLTINLVDPYIFSILIRNMIHNAIKYSKESGEIVLRAIRKGDGIEYSIKDFGIGIDEKTLILLGENYAVKKPKLGTFKEKGSGIGLALCYKLVKHIGGTISIKSQKNQFTKVLIYFPKMT